MNQIKIYLLLSILINFVMICCGYLVGQIDGELVDGMRIEISIGFIGAPDKYLMQAIDTKQNRLSIKTNKTFSQYDRELIIDFNGLLASLNASNWRNGEGEIFQLLITFEFKQNNLYYQYGYDNSILLLSNNYQNKQINSSSISSDWPNDGDLHKLINKTRIWFGYSNNIDKIYSDWPTNQIIIIGCIHWLYANNEYVKLEMKDGNIDNFYIDCKRNDVIECNQHGSCRNETIHDYYHYHILYCKSSMLINTARYCYQDLSNNNMDLYRSHRRIGNESQSVIVKLAWITQQSINQCLLEINTRNNSLIEIYLNSSNQIILAIKHDKSINWSKHILYEISSNQIHVIRIEFTESKSTFQVSNGSLIQTLILPQLGSVKLINVGWSLGTNLCLKLNTKFVIRYDPNQFRSFNDSNIMDIILRELKKTQKEPKINSTNNSSISQNELRQVLYWIIFLIVIISISCNMLNCIGWIIGKIKKQKHFPARNIYKEPREMNNLTPPTTADIKEGIDNIYDE